MRKILEKIASPVPAKVSVTLEHADRQKSRGLLRLDDGTEAALILERGSALKQGDRLIAEDGLIIAVEAARESLSIVTAADPRDLMRAAYHLGNRHIPVQIEAARLAYLHDHVLDDMVRELGFSVAIAAEPFEPESGAYGAREGHGHAHLHRPSERPRAASVRPHTHGHDHAQDHDHDRAHDHDHKPAPSSTRRSHSV